MDLSKQIWELAGPVVAAVPVEEIVLALGLLVRYGLILLLPEVFFQM